MVDVYRTEEEQVEALKRWWKENGSSILVGAALALAVIGGWKWWNERQQATAEAAGLAYFNLQQALLSNTQQKTDAASLEVGRLVGVLKNDFDDTSYAIFAAMLSAKEFVNEGDLVSAEQELQWAIAHASEDSSLYLIAALRQARVISAQGGEDNLNRALVLIEDQRAGGHTASYEETKGDIYQALGREADARVAYDKALTELERLGGNRPMLQAKHDDLAAGDS